MSDLQLIEAVKAGQLPVVKELLASGADVNQQDGNGWTPLNWAAGKGDLPSVRLLVEHGADVRKTGRDLRTPAMIAVAAGRVETARFLRRLESELQVEDAERKYCRAYYLKDLRQFDGWPEGGPARDGTETDGAEQDAIAYVHEDYHVTRSIWAREDILFDGDTPEWREFCHQTLNFHVPDDLDLIGAASTETTEG